MLGLVRFIMIEDQPRKLRYVLMYAHIHEGCRKGTEGQYGKVRKDVLEKYGKVRKDTFKEKYGRSFAWQIDQTCDQALNIRKLSG